MRIVLINAPVSGYNIRDLYLAEPLGVAYLAAYLDKNGFETQILDCFTQGFHQIFPVNDLLRRGMTNSQIREALVKINADVIGIHSNFTTHYPDAENVARVARETFPGRPIVFGGAHATMDATNIVAKGVADYVVRGEGELTAVELFRALWEKADTSAIQGITYKDRSGKVCHTPDRPLIQDINSLPFPAREKLDMDIYLKNSKEVAPVAMKYPVASILTSRGCQYDCVFCSTKNMWKRKWRGDSAQRVIEEIEMLYNKYGVREVVIMDDNFLGNRKRFHDILDMLIEKKMDLTLSILAGVTVWVLDKPLLTKMQKAGFYRLMFPVETGSQEAMKFINKPVNLVQAKELVQEANRIGLWTQAPFLIGFPYETREDIMKTLDYAFKFGVDFAFFYVVQPYPGADLYEVFKKEGLLQNMEEKRSTVLKSKYNTLHMKAEELDYLRDWANVRYLLRRILSLMNPVYFAKYFWPKINTFKKFAYFARATSTNLGFLFTRHRRMDIDTNPEALMENLKTCEESSSDEVNKEMSLVSDSGRESRTP
jgi:radical SAM superfamily enzyme YgiQ (UPF0313 family)